MKHCPSTLKLTRWVRECQDNRHSFFFIYSYGIIIFGGVGGIKYQGIKSSVSYQKGLLKWPLSSEMFSGGTKRKHSSCIFIHMNGFRSLTKLLTNHLLLNLYNWKTISRMTMCILRKMLPHSNFLTIKSDSSHGGRTWRIHEVLKWKKICMYSFVHP